jgi:CRISPR-associated protein Csx14
VSHTIRIPVDVTNPGQFFACCGLLELAGRWYGNVVANFTSDGFQLAGCHPATSPDDLVQRLLQTPELASSVTKASMLNGSKSKLLPVTLTLGAHSGLRLDWWRDEARPPHKGSVNETCAPSAFKTWTAQQSPQQILYDRLLPAIRRFITSGVQDLLWQETPLTGRFGLEPTAATVALDVGWSPDGLDLPVASSPAIELLAAIGLQRFRPELDSQSRWVCRYRTWATPLPPTIAAAACAGAIVGVPTRTYRFRIGERGDYKYFEHAVPEGDTP